MQMLNLKQARATIKLVATAGKKLDERIHQIAVSGINHYLGEGNGDTTILTELAHAMPKSARGKALAYWTTKNCNVKWSSKAHAGKGGYVKVNKKEKPTGTLEAAIAMPFWEKPEDGPSQFKGYDREAEVLNFVKRLKAKEAKLAELSEDDSKKVKLDVSAAAIDSLMSFCDFEADIVEA